MVSISDPLTFDSSYSLWLVIAEEEDPDNMEEISTDNILNDGRRTRGKTIDFAKAAAEAKAAGENLDDDEDDDDDDFEEKEDEKMHE